MKTISLLLLISTLSVASTQTCYETLKLVEHYALLAIKEESKTYRDIAIYYSDKAQIDCVTRADSMDVTRHLKKELEKSK